MPVQVIWEPFGLYYLPFGNTTAEEVRYAQKFALSPPEDVIPKFQLVDGRNTDLFDLDHRQLVDVSADDLSYTRKYDIKYVAFVIKKQNVENKFFEIFKLSWAMNTDAEWRMFTNMKDAREWIGVPFPVAEHLPPTDLRVGARCTAYTGNLQGGDQSKNP